MARELRNMYYVDGSTVRRVGYREAYPQERPAYPERPVHQPRKQPVTYRRAAIRAEKSLAFDLRYTLLLTAMFAIMIASCIVMLYVQGEVNSRERRITSLQQQIQTITADNAAYENNLNGMYSLEDIYKIIDSLEMTDGARELSRKVFHILAEAEAKAHKKEINEVHFHEVGAIDSIVDIVSAAVCFDNLGITDVVVKRLCEGHGNVRCQHGIIPVPVPAVINICAKYALPLSITDRRGEYVTPTGAAFVAAVMTSKELPEVMTVEKVGLGAGKREHEIPGVLRAMIIK